MTALGLLRTTYGLLHRVLWLEAVAGRQRECLALQDIVIAEQERELGAWEGRALAAEHELRLSRAQVVALTAGGRGE